MGMDPIETTINIIKVIFIFLMMVQAVPILVWVERRGSAFIQNRLGPNRVGPLGLMQLLADAIKFIFKEEFAPQQGVAFIYYAAPVVALVPAALALAAIPLSTPIDVAAFEWLGGVWGPYHFKMQGYEIGIGIIFVLGISSLGAYALLMAGWGSSNKYSLMGALRASAQMVSYELSMGLTLLGSLLIYGTFSLNEIVTSQSGPLVVSVLGQIKTIAALPNWGFFVQPLGAVLFFIAAFAECNRLPFDLPEAEGELVAGFHTEYGGFKMLLFFIGEYGHMIVTSSLLVVFFFGGYQIPFLTSEQILSWATQKVYSQAAATALCSAIFLLSFLIKVGFFLWVFVWVRWTLPRFRYDRLMDLGWKTLLPWSLANTVITAVVLFFNSRF